MQIFIVVVESIEKTFVKYPCPIVNVSRSTGFGEKHLDVVEMRYFFPDKIRRVENQQRGTAKDDITQADRFGREEYGDEKWNDQKKSE